MTSPSSHANSKSANTSPILASALFRTQILVLKDYPVVVAEYCVGKEATLQLDRRDERWSALDGGLEPCDEFGDGRDAGLRDHGGGKAEDGGVTTTEIKVVKACGVQGQTMSGWMCTGRNK